MAKRTCSIEGCDNPERSLGWCNLHYMRNRDHGDPLYNPKSEDTQTARLIACLENFEEVDGCWLWLGYLEKTGHAKTKYRDKRIGVHVGSYIVHNGPVPQGLQVNHLCGNAHCLNPDHLYAGTQRQNMMDKWRDGTWQRGERIASSKLTEGKVIEILMNSTNSSSELAQMYGVCSATINNIRRRKSWKHIQVPEDAAQYW